MKSDASSLAEICRAAGYAIRFFRTRSLTGPRGDITPWKTSRTICTDWTIPPSLKHEHERKRKINAAGPVLRTWLYGLAELSCRWAHCLRITVGVTCTTTGVACECEHWRQDKINIFICHNITLDSLSLSNGTIVSPIFDFCFGKNNAKIE